MGKNKTGPRKHLLIRHKVKDRIRLHSKKIKRENHNEMALHKKKLSK